MQSVPGRQRRSVDVADLKAHADELVAEVRASGEPIDITADGRVVAEIRSAGSQVNGMKRREWTDEDIAAWNRGMDELAAEIDAALPPEVTAEEILRDMRRDL